MITSNLYPTDRAPAGSVSSPKGMGMGEKPVQGPRPSAARTLVFSSDSLFRIDHFVTISIHSSILRLIIESYHRKVAIEVFRSVLKRKHENIEYVNRNGLVSCIF
jgi:hypothetical protein